MRWALIVLTIAAGATAVGADTLVVLNKSDATATLFDPGSNAELATIRVGDGPHEAAVSPDGKTAVAANYGGRTAGSSLTVIDLVARKAIATIDLGKYRRPHGLQFLPDGNRLAVTVEDNRALIIVDIRQRRVVRAIDTDARVSHMVALAPGGKRAYVSNIGSGSVTALDLAAGKRLKTIETGAGAEGLDISPDGREVWVGNRAADTISVIDTRRLEVVARLKSASFPIRVKFTPDGRHVLVSNLRSNDIAVFDARSRKEVRRIAMGPGRAPIGILIEPSGKRAFVANTVANVVSVVDLTSWKVTGSITAGRTPDGMAYSPR